MSKLVKEIAGLCYHLDKLYYEEENKKVRAELKKNFDILSKLLERSIRSSFDENEKFYKKGVREIRKSIREINKVKEGLAKIDRFIADLSQLSENVSSLISGKNIQP
ncbi:MAG: hypothetical protein ABFR75_12425 [Acidobacteriota bacterium]